MFRDRFNMLVLKIIMIIKYYFNTFTSKNHFEINRCHNVKHAFTHQIDIREIFLKCSIIYLKCSIVDLVSVNI
jgi:hypothetical protein